MEQSSIGSEMILNMVIKYMDILFYDSQCKTVV